ncbi:unnamed protein product [Paramecium pentaurelia]|uniref:FYVE-type domain-containing protein n=1 Tax=Paramecium pentaurelia TaxID=43138 RepID=A0A8S1W8C3_9CILI|nr:unnamed protein product [Paramecium pentaurelia]
MSQRKSLTQAHIKTVLISEGRGKFKRCQLCQKEFGLLKPEHQCKRCRRAVCKQCSEHKIIYITETGPSKRPRRICNSCKDESDWIKRFIEQQKIVFGTNTFAVEWLKASNITLEHANQEYEKAQSSIKENSDYQKMKSELNSVMIELWLNLNFSLREFITYLIKDNEHELLTQKISKVLGSLLLQYPEIGYSSDQILITLFLLCFSSEASAYALLTVLYSNIIPFNTYPSQLKKTPYDYLNETEKVSQVLEQAFKLKQSEVTLVKPFLRNRISRYIQPFGINFFLLQTSFFFFNQVLLGPTLGYDNYLKCLASSFYVSFDEIKQFNQQFEEIEGQIMKGVSSGMIEKNYVQTKLIIFLSHQQGMTQSVIVSRPLEKNKETHQIKIEFKKDENIQQRNEQDDDMLEYSVTQSNEFQNLRRKTVQISQQPQVDEEKETLKKYILQIEELLMTKHKLVTELQLQVKELQNQPLQIINQDVDQQLLEANDQLRKKISLQDLEIQSLQEQKKYSDKIQEDNQNIINNLQKSNSEIYAQLNAQILQNKELQQQISDLQQLSNQQSDNSMTASQVEKNYQINISLQSKQSEQELTQLLDEDRQKIFQLELQVNQLNKEYIALQQLNQDKLRIIGNLEVRLIHAEAAKRENEKFQLENIDIKKKLQNHELVIIQQTEQLQLLQQRYDLRCSEIDAVKKEKFNLAEELSQKDQQHSQILQPIQKQLADLHISYNSISEQLSEALSINQKLQQIIIEKDKEISEHYKQLSERDLIIVALKEADILMKDRISNLQRQLEENQTQLHKIQQELQTNNDRQLQTQNEASKNKEQLQQLINEHQLLTDQHRLIIIELDDYKAKWIILNQDHTTLRETHNITINELDLLKQRFAQLNNDHNTLQEQHRQSQIQFEQERNNSAQIQEKNRIIDELSHQLNKIEETHQITIQIHLTKIQELELIIITHEKKMLEFKSLSEQQKIEITELMAKIAQLESDRAEHIAKNQSLTIQLTANIEKLNELENKKNNLEQELVQLQKRVQELNHHNGEQKVLIIQLEERITLLITEVKTKEGENVKLIQLIETQKQSMIDYEELIRKLKAQIVELEKHNLKLKTTLKHYKELSKEMAELD